MQATLKDKFQTEATLIPGQGGTFLVQLDGQTLYDKHQSGRFPEDPEIVELIKKKRGA